MHIKVDIYEDNQNLLNSLRMLLGVSEDMLLGGAYLNCLKVEENTLANQPDVIIMDINMPGIDGVEGVRRCKKVYPNIHILMYTVNEDSRLIFDALCAGANGYLLKKTAPNKLLEAIRDVYNGGAPMSPSIARKVLRTFNKGASAKSNYNLSPRETELLGLLSNGRSYKQIAAELYISIDTVRKHLQNIYAKLHVNCGTEAVAKALRHNIIQ